MKKTVLAAAALVTASALSAQTGEITSNRGENWLSQDGDWGLTIDARPFLDFAGNLFNGNTGNRPFSGGGFVDRSGNSRSDSLGSGGVIIRGKKLIDANTAYRAEVRIGFGSVKNTSLVQQADQSDATVTVENVAKTSHFNLNLGAGLEKRVGSTRVVGVYGAQLNLGLGNAKTTNEYGNALTTTNQEGGSARQTEMKYGSTFSIGLSAFGGVEYFFAPKMSLSGEYTWGLALQSSGFNELTTERWDATANNNAGGIVTTTTEGPTGKRNAFGIDTGISHGGFVGLNFYFQ